MRSFNYQRLFIFFLAYFICFSAIIAQNEAPDYSKLQYWVSHPEKADSADMVPPAAGPERQSEAIADVFFIHPTTYLKGDTDNADINDAELCFATEKRAVKHQASVFNASCKVYAPHYRQMNLQRFGPKNEEELKVMKTAIDFAYEDVKTAFEYYLKHQNEGRPIVIAGHSQGALHGIRLVKEFFDEKELADQLVAAYLVGWPFPADTFGTLPVCNSADQTGCVMGWASWKKGKIPKSYDSFYKGAVVTNPLNWKSDDSYAAEELHQGVLLGDFKKVHKNKVDAQGHNGILWVEKPIKLWPRANFHIADINLFWFNIRENVGDRVSAFKAKRNLSAE